jgi:phage terminase large subunit GpA-like protein
MGHYIEAIRRQSLFALIPPPRLQLGAWIEQNLVLPEGTSALPGRVRLWPYQRAIADAIGDPTIERVTLVKPVRVGFTTLLTGPVGAFVANDPAPILALLPTESDCRDYVVSEIEPIFAATPILAGCSPRARPTRSTGMSVRPGVVEGVETPPGSCPQGCGFASVALPHRNEIAIMRSAHFLWRRCHVQCD